MKTSKATTIVTSNVFNATFKRIGAESLTLNATLRNIAALAAIDKDAKVVAEWLGVKSGNVTGKALSDLRTSIMDQVVFYTQPEGENVQPVNLVKVATIDNVNFYQARPISWLAALKMICNRKNKQLEVKHTLLEGGDTIYNTLAEAVTDVDIIAKVNDAIEQVKAEKCELKNRKDIAASGDVEKIRELADRIAAEKQAAQ